MIRLDFIEYGCMSLKNLGPESFRIRRATNEDLEGLRELWQADRLPGEMLEKRFGEFQVVELATGGPLLAALALQKLGKDGFIHSETYRDFALSDTLRPLLWERFQNMIQNHGLYRVWTGETAPFWKQIGFAAPGGDKISKFP